MDRLSSLETAIVASFVPGSYISNLWHTTIASHEKSGFAAGGGGFIAGHFYFWGSWIGVLLCSMLVSFLIKMYLTSKSNLHILLSILLFGTFPRWIAYEPIALLFRISIYFSMLYILLNSWNYSIQIGRQNQSVSSVV
jgi:hypothetical protein